MYVLSAVVFMASRPVLEIILAGNFYKRNLSMPPSFSFLVRSCPVDSLPERRRLATPYYHPIMSWVLPLTIPGTAHAAVTFGTMNDYCTAKIITHKIPPLSPDSPDDADDTSVQNDPVFLSTRMTHVILQLDQAVDPTDPNLHPSQVTETPHFKPGRDERDLGKAMDEIDIVLMYLHGITPEEECVRQLAPALFLSAWQAGRNIAGGSGQLRKRAEAKWSSGGRLLKCTHHHCLLGICYHINGFPLLWTRILAAAAAK